MANEELVVPQGVKARHWVFTQNNYDALDEGSIQRFASLHCTSLVYAREVAPTTGTPHLQGYFRLKGKGSMATTIQNKLKAESRKTIGFPYLKVAFAPREACEYCYGGVMKEGVMKPVNPPESLFEHGNPRRDAGDNGSNGFKEWCAAVKTATSVFELSEYPQYYMPGYAERAEAIIRSKEFHLVRLDEIARFRLDYPVLNEFQLSIEGFLNDLPGKKILWIYDSVGDHGKSVLGQHWEINVPGTQIVESDQFNNMVMDLPTVIRRMVVDCTRSVEFKSEDLYKFLEGCVNGRLVGKKYRGTRVSVQGPTIVFSNFVPVFPKITRTKVVLKSYDHDSATWF